MKSWRLIGSAQHPELVETDVPQPKPREGEVLVRVYAAGITPTEVLWSPSWQTKNGEKRTGAIPSHEFSGEIAETGEEIYGMNDWFAEGALAEYCVTQPAWIAPKPPHLTHAEAASVPIGALTAWQGLFDRAKLQPGERVLIHGGAGGVGIFAIQLAHSHGAYVIATVSPRNAEFVTALGANEVIDYKSAPFEDKARDIDVVFDTVGGDTLRRSWNVLKPNGRLVTIAADAETPPDERTKQAFFIVEPNRQQLMDMIGNLRPVVDTVLPFSQAADSYTGHVKKQGRGKVVVAVRPA
jgi:NADPH:quinone reductase-like Zn-dependent oxidoreductase